MGEKKKILIIDDEENFTKLVKMNLEATGKYEVKIENKGILGFSAAKEFKPDLILLDILMPDMEGSEVISQLNDDMDTKNIPVVFLTAIIKEKEVKESGGVIAGHRFIAKPVSADKLIEVIERTLISD
jgi:CheY-like chemotaxis protein